MKRIIIVAALLLAAITLSAQSTVDSTTQGFIDAGMDPVIAGQLGGVIRLSMAGAVLEKGRVDRLTNDFYGTAGAFAALQTQVNNNETKEESDNAAVNTRISNLPGSAVSRSSAAGYSSLIQAAFPIGQAKAVGTLALAGCGDGYPKLQFGTAGAGSSFDYVVWIPSAASYSISLRFCVGAAGTVPLVMHLESPPGTPVGQVISYMPTNAAATILNATPQPVAFQPGPQFIRLLVDSTPTNTANYIQWISVARQ